MSSSGGYRQSRNVKTMKRLQKRSADEYNQMSVTSSESREACSYEEWKQVPIKAMKARVYIIKIIPS